MKKVHNYEITLDEAMDNQERLENLIIRLENYNAKNKKNKNRREKESPKICSRIVSGEIKYC